MEEGSLVFRNFLGDVYRYPESELELESITPECLHKRLKAIESGAA